MSRSVIEAGEIRSDRSIRARLFKNTSYLTVGNQVGNVGQFLFFLYFARGFGEAVVGRYSFGFSFTYVLSVLADLGMSAYLIREVARDGAGGRDLIWRGVVLRLLSLLFLSVFGVLTATVFFKGLPVDTILVLALLGMYQLFLSIADVFLAEFKGHDRMALVAVLNCIVKIFIAGAGIVMVLEGLSYLTVMACFPVGAFVYLLVCVHISHRSFGGFKLHLGQLELGRLFNKLMPFALTVIFVESLYHIDILLLRFFTDDQTVGLYSVSQKLVMVFVGILAFVYTALLPAFSVLYGESEIRLREVSRQCLRYLILIGLPIAAGLSAISERAIVLFFSEKFAASIQGAEILSWTVALCFAAAPYHVLLIAINRQAAKSAAIGICVAANLGLNLFLIPKFGYLGAAWAKLATEALILAVLSYLGSRYFKNISLLRILPKPALSCLVMYITIKALGNMSLLGIVVVAPLVYFGVLTILGSYEKEEIDWVKGNYRRLFAKTVN